MRCTFTLGWFFVFFSPLKWPALNAWHFLCAFEEGWEWHCYVDDDGDYADDGDDDNNNGDYDDCATSDSWVVMIMMMKCIVDAFFFLDFFVLL